MPQPYKLFTIYAREDAQYLEELRGQLRPLEHAGRIRVWSDREINPGVDWEREIVQNLDSADIILILVSAAYYNSAYIHEKEITHAISRHERGEAKVLPVIVRPCSFLDDPVISRLQVLPTDGKPVTDRRHWAERDDAWLDVVAGVKRTLDVIREAENRTEQEIRDASERERLAAERKKEEEKRVRQAETEARERAERERREAEQRTREEQARYEREAEATRQREAQLKREREEKERLERLRREQEDAYQRADSAAWMQASNAHTIEAYHTYLSQFPQGEMVREARVRIKEIKRENVAPMPLGYYAAIGGGLFVLLLAVWLLPKMFGGDKSGGLTSSQPITAKEDTTKTAPLKQDTSSQIIGATSSRSATSPKPFTADPFDKQMVWVEGGTFIMGSPITELSGFDLDQGRDDDECQHKVSIRSFNIGKYEVTQAQWKGVMGNNPSKHKICDDCPVEQVSWDDVQVFLKKLNNLTGKKYRLPTEREWEYAARGGKKSRGFTYAGSNTLSNVAWYGDNSNREPQPVGGKEPNELGLYDMSGNLREWCADRTKRYSCSKSKVGLSGMQMRGGDYRSLEENCRSGSRFNNFPSWRNDFTGFRLAHD